MKEKEDKTSTSRASTLSSPWLFFALVFCWSWFFWLSAAALRTSIQTTLGRTLLLLGLLGPMVGGIGFTYLTQGKEGRREYWSRMVDPKRIGGIWYLVILLFVPTLMAIAVLLDVASGGTGTLVNVENRVTPFLSAPLTIVPFALGVFIHGPFPEEMGWRGYVLDRLQSRWNALEASLILGAIWALWHLPLFFIKDMIHYTQGVWSPWFWQFMVGVIPMAVILTWIFNNTRRSTLAAILFHFVANVSYPLGNVTAGTNFYSTLLWIIAAIAVVALWGVGAPTRREYTPSG
jgi:uncharacterized protein